MNENNDRDDAGARVRLVSLKAVALIVFVVAGLLYVGVRGRAQSSRGGAAGNSQSAGPFDNRIEGNARQMFEQGRQIFRFDTFGDEAFWTDKLQLHKAIEGANHGGSGSGVSPKTALAVGLKVDMDALPAALVEQVKRGEVNLDDPATTLALIKLNAVLGVKGTFNADGSLKAVGLSCAVCHSTVDDAFAPGIGHRLDGWANRDLNTGAIISLAPDLSVFTGLLKVDEPTVRKVLASWGPGKFDAELNLDGKAFRPDGKPAATLIPPAFGMAGVNLHTWTGGWGTATYWNAFVANLELQGQGTFFDERLNDPKKYPVAARAGFGNKRSATDMITSKLAALQFYQLAIPAPTPPAGSFDAAAATRGESIFNGKANCAQCHVPPLFTEPGWNAHKASDIGIDDFQAMRSPDNTYRTSPLRGLFTHAKGGFYHDGRFATLMDVVNHYDSFKRLGLSSQEKNDLVEYLKSL
jgi:mono/diheme cytochrome c family protein